MSIRNHFTYKYGNFIWFNFIIIGIHACPLTVFCAPPSGPHPPSIYVCISQHTLHIIDTQNASFKFQVSLVYLNSVEIKLMKPATVTLQQ